MQTATLEAVMKQTGQAPYGKSLKIKIVASDLVKSLTNEKGESKQVLNLVPKLQKQYATISQSFQN